MFTGIVEEIGTVSSLRRGAHSSVVGISASVVTSDLKIGDSVAVNGTCLTATAVSAKGFTADVMHETLDRSSLAGLRPGDVVNLERAMAANGRFGGHIVSGHIDGTGTIERVRRDDDAVWYAIRAPRSITDLVVEKGSIAIDGISLTVARASPTGFEVSIIPHTLAQTILSRKGPGDVVNLETDVVGKYVRHLLGLSGASGEAPGEASGAPGTSSGSGSGPASGSSLDLAFLARCGF